MRETERGKQSRKKNRAGERENKRNDEKGHGSKAVRTYFALWYLKRHKGRVLESLYHKFSVNIIVNIIVLHFFFFFEQKIYILVSLRKHKPQQKFTVEST